MASAEKYYVKEVLQELSEYFSDVCEFQTNTEGDSLATVYSGSRPSVTDNHSEFLVISLSRSVYSHGPYQNAAAYVDIYVRNGQDGIERTWRLQELCDMITGRFPHSSIDEDSGIARWTISKPKLVLDGDDSLGFTAWRIRSRLFVNTTDRYKTISDI